MEQSPIIIAVINVSLRSAISNHFVPLGRTVLPRVETARREGVAGLLRRARHQEVLQEQRVRLEL